MRVISLTGATSVLDPVHGEHHAGPDGVFDLPQQFADHLLRTAAGSFRGEADHLSLLARESLEQLRDPRVALLALSDLRGRMDALEAQVAGLVAAQSASPAEAGQEPAAESTSDADDDETTEDCPDTEPEPEEASEPEPDEPSKPTAKRRPGTDTPPRTRPATKRQA